MGRHQGLQGHKLSGTVPPLLFAMELLPPLAGIVDILAPSGQNIEYDQVGGCQLLGPRRAYLSHEPVQSGGAFLD